MQFWVMVGTLVTAVGTLILGVGVVIAGLQFRHQRRVPGNDIRSAAVVEVQTLRRQLVMDLSTFGGARDQAQKYLLAAERFRSAFNFAGKEFRLATLNFDLFLLEQVMALYSKADVHSVGQMQKESLVVERSIIANAALEANEILEKVALSRPDFGRLAEQLDRLRTDSTQKIEETVNK